MGMTTDEKVSRATIQLEMTTRWSTLHYQMNYRGFFFNHLLHGIVALWELGASKDQLHTFARNYTTKLEKQPRGHTDVFVQAEETLEHNKLTMERARELLLGKRTNFDELLALYAVEMKQLGIDDTVKKHLPFLVSGLAGGLLHGIIHLGYAHHLGGERLVAEALAYCHFAYLPFDDPERNELDYFATKKTLSRQEALQLLCTLGNHDRLREEMRHQMEKRDMTRPRGGGALTAQLADLSSDSERGSRAAFQLISDAIHNYDLLALRGTFVLDLALWIFVMIEHNDFVIVHTVTSAWALMQLEHLLNEDDRLRAWTVWLQVTLSAYVTREIQDMHETDIFDDDKWKMELPELPSWEEIVAKTLALEGLPDEHIYKMVQVTRDHATNAATAPNEAEKAIFLSSEQRDFIARKSAVKVLTQKFTTR